LTKASFKDRSIIKSIKVGGSGDLRLWALPEDERTRAQEAGEDACGERLIG
jgi:hypothetical protein